MSLKNIPFTKLAALIKKYLNTQEYETTPELIKSLSGVRKRGYLKRDEFIEICKWKSPRAIHHIRANREKKIKRISRLVFKTSVEKDKFELLTSLKGVSGPMASAIMMMTNPKRYGVIDIRVWQLLYAMGAVSTKPKGNNLGFNEWYRFLMIIRHFSGKFRVKARDIERALFEAHKEYQDGLLYS
jgi:hypothetical protein